MSYNVYLAAPWVAKDRARSVGEAIVAAGHGITEPWWDHPESTDPEELERQAKRDINGVQEADIVIVLNIEKSEGKAVETGYAIAMCIPVIVVGAASNLFHYLKQDVLVVGSVEEAIDAIGRF